MRHPSTLYTLKNIPRQCPFSLSKLLGVAAPDAYVAVEPTGDRSYHIGVSPSHQRALDLAILGYLPKFLANDLLLEVQLHSKSVQGRRRPLLLPTVTSAKKSPEGNLDPKLLAAVCCFLKVEPGNISI